VLTLAPFLFHQIEIEPDLLKQLKQLESEGVMLAENDRLEEATQKFTEAIKLCPTYASAYNNR
jgi:hypothetical protein